ncbi:MAG: alpha/beta fold hydrolase [Thermoanaerobaculia bacterium]|nr:alpha/beta fold hydrolase [Thermoanaerobaculia bacterium]
MLRGHLWTIAPRVRHALGRQDPTESNAAVDSEWSTQVADDRWGSVRLSGLLGTVAGARGLVIVVPGLGGARNSHYMAGAARGIVEAGMSYLLFEPRGSDLTGEDLYHAGLTADLVAAVASSELRSYETIHLLGYSLGGHLVLRYATLQPDPRVASVAAVCSPLDLHAAQEAFDKPARWLYRQYILGRLRRLYRPIAMRRDLASSLEAVVAAKTLREWDRLTVVPRFGFSDPDDYYTQMSVSKRLDQLATPALLVASQGDPMVPPEALEPVLAQNVGRLRVEWVDGGGHVSFPDDVDLGFPGPKGLEGQVVSWLRQPGSQA